MKSISLLLIFTKKFGIAQHHLNKFTYLQEVALFSQESFLLPVYSPYIVNYQLIVVPYIVLRAIHFSSMGALIVQHMLNKKVVIVIVNKCGDCVNIGINVFIVATRMQLNSLY